MKNFARELGIEMGNSFLHFAGVTFIVAVTAVANSSFQNSFGGILL